MKPVIVDTRKITDWKSFHDLFSQLFGFPPTYGRNMDAWVDCMTCLDKPAAGMSQLHAQAGGVVTLHLQHIADFEQRCPDLWSALLDCTAFVNWRRLEAGESPILALAYFRGA